MTNSYSAWNFSKYWILEIFNCLFRWIIKRNQVHWGVVTFCKCFLYDPQLYLASLRLLVDLYICHALANGMWKEMSGLDRKEWIEMFFYIWSCLLDPSFVMKGQIACWSLENLGVCSRPHPNESWSQAQRTLPKCQTSHRP